MHQSRQGYWSAIGCYVIWGVMPIYMRLMKSVPPLQIVTHRLLWSCLILLGILWFSKNLKSLISVITPKLLAIYTLSALCIGSNWLLYVLGTNQGQVTEVSLGYFINPLVSVLLGVVVLGERLRPWQIAAVGLGVIGVSYLSYSYGSIPWLALGLALSFGFYGLIRKMAPLGATQGLGLETFILLPFALAYMTYLMFTHQSAFTNQGWGIDLLLLSAGLVTTVPLLLFNNAAQKISLTLMGVFQYIGPSLQFLIGIFLYDEPISHEVLTGFICVWVGLFIFAMEGFWRHQTRSRNAA